MCTGLCVRGVGLCVLAWGGGCVRVQALALALARRRRQEGGAGGCVLRYTREPELCVDVAGRLYVFSCVDLDTLQ
jgi:hypothetical protein